VTEITEVSGEVGRFKVRLREKARSVDPEKCTGCGACTRACPVHNIIQIPAKPPLPSLSLEWEAALNETLSVHQNQRTALIAMLQEINRTFGYLPRALLTHLADRLDISLAEVVRVATFYNAFSLIPIGRHIIEICTGTACHVGGAGRLMDRLREELQIDAGQTTEDNRFTLRTVNCMGCCALAPALRVDGNTYGYVKIAELPSILSDHQ
jgi:NADH-quinone oxidoreductase subunit E